MTGAERLKLMRLEVPPKPAVEAFGRLFRRQGAKIGIGNNGLTLGSEDIGTWDCCEAERILEGG